MKNIDTLIEEVKETYQQDKKVLDREIISLKKEIEKLKITKDYAEELEERLLEEKKRSDVIQNEMQALRTLTQAQYLQLDDYRKKDAQYQETIEDLKCQIELLLIENKGLTKRMDEEVQRVKQSFQKKIEQRNSLSKNLRSLELQLHQERLMREVVEKENESLRFELERERNTFIF